MNLLKDWRRYRFRLLSKKKAQREMTKPTLKFQIQSDFPLGNLLDVSVSKNLFLWPCLFLCRPIPILRHRRKTDGVYPLTPTHKSSGCIGTHEILGIRNPFLDITCITFITAQKGRVLGIVPVSLHLQLTLFLQLQHI